MGLQLCGPICGLFFEASGQAHGVVGASQVHVGERPKL